MPQTSKQSLLFCFFLCLLFFVSYTFLAIVRHAHYQSFGFDLGIVDQIVWKYSAFKFPITTVHHFAFTSIFTDHIEFIFILLAPFYWLWNNVYTLIILQTLFICASGIPVFLLAKNHKLNDSPAYMILICYLSFYGIQNAVWFDVHSLSFAIFFLAWFIYFLDYNNSLWTYISFFLAIICKEDIAFLTLLISLVYSIKTRRKITLILIAVSALYLFLIFFIYFPHFTHDGYRFTNKGGLLADLNPTYLFDTNTKKQIIFYSLAWYGFLPLFCPLYLLPAAGDIVHYFVFGHNVPTAQEFFMHYRIALAPLLALPAIKALGKFKKLNNTVFAIILLLWTLLVQYSLHAPLSYLVKSWFWTEPKSVKNIQAVISYIPPTASVVSQNNITPHISHRDYIFTLWPEKRNTGDFFRWDGNPRYLVVDTSADWDIRHFLTQRQNFIQGIYNLEHYGYIKKYKQNGNAILFIILKHP